MTKAKHAWNWLGTFFVLSATLLLLYHGLILRDLSGELIVQIAPVLIAGFACKGWIKEVILTAANVAVLRFESVTGSMGPWVFFAQLFVQVYLFFWLARILIPRLVLWAGMLIRLFILWMEAPASSARLLGRAHENPDRDGDFPEYPGAYDNLTNRGPLGALKRGRSLSDT